MPGKTSAKSAKAANKSTAKPVLLSGGNPQIAKRYGDGNHEGDNHEEDDERFEGG